MRIKIISSLIIFLYIVFMMHRPFEVMAIGNSKIVINRNSESRFLYHDKNIKALIDENHFSAECDLLEDFAQPLIKYQLERFDEAEYEFRVLIRKFPMCADARAGLTALLWHKGYIGEAESHWNAAFGLDKRYCYRDWLLNTRHWPAKPTEDLVAFLQWIKR